jgi:hypothetical protein
MRSGAAFCTSLILPLWEMLLGTPKAVVPNSIAVVAVITTMVRISVLRRTMVRAANAALQAKFLSFWSRGFQLRFVAHIAFAARWRERGTGNPPFRRDHAEIQRQAQKMSGLQQSMLKELAANGFSSFPTHTIVISRRG